MRFIPFYYTIVMLLQSAQLYVYSNTMERTAEVGIESCHFVKLVIIYLVYVV